jgi:hypothetical protein
MDRIWFARTARKAHLSLCYGVIEQMQMVKPYTAYVYGSKTNLSPAPTIYFKNVYMRSNMKRQMASGITVLPMSGT